MKMIACVDQETLALGSNNKLLFNCKADMKFFREKTMHKIVIMGAKTYKSIGSHYLKGRLNIVVTHHPDQYKDDDKSDAIFVYGWQAYRLLSHMRDSDNVMIIGGAEIYRLFIDFCDEIYLTEAYRKNTMQLPEDTVYFPKQIRDRSIWRKKHCFKRTYGVNTFIDEDGEEVTETVCFRINLYKRVNTD